MIKSEIEQKSRQEEKLKNDVNSVIEETEKDCQFYISEISRQSEALDMLASQTKGMCNKATTSHSLAF